MIHRILEPALRAANRSILLLGPRQVGKSTLLTSLAPELTINLADEEQLFRFAGNPGELRIQLETYQPKTVLVDEIQRLPSLLNTIQSVIDSKRGITFLLSGSSARKLRRGNANLLPGRVLPFQLGPLVLGEISKAKSIESILKYGLLPEVFLEESDQAKRQLLSAYSTLYLNEEIKAEALVRNLESFTRFFSVATESTGLFIDYSKLAHRSKVSRHSFSRFYEILEDTLIGQRIWPFKELLEKADLIKHPKFYLFDTGVYNALMRNFECSADRIGILAEQLVFTQLRHSAWAKNIPAELSTFRTRGGLEVDFILELDRAVFAIEVKASGDLTAAEVEPLKAFRRYYPKVKGAFVAHLGSTPRKIANIWCLPIRNLLDELGLA